MTAGTKRIIHSILRPLGPLTIFGLVNVDSYTFTNKTIPARVRERRSGKGSRGFRVSKGAEKGRMTWM